jgi:hypothetical protein
VTQKLSDRPNIVAIFGAISQVYEFNATLSPGHERWSWLRCTSAAERAGYILVARTSTAIGTRDFGKTLDFVLLSSGWR